MIYLCVHLLVCLRSSVFDTEIEDVIATIMLLLQSHNEVIKILSAVISLKEIICIALFTSTMMTNPDACVLGLKKLARIDLKKISLTLLFVLECP